MKLESKIKMLVAQFIIEKLILTQSISCTLKEINQKKKKSKRIG